MKSCVRLSGVYYRIKDRLLLKDLELELGENEKIAIVGSNGCGKSTVMRMIAGLIKPESGTICLFDHVLSTPEDVRQGRKKLGYLFQDCDDQFIAPTVLEDVAFALLAQGAQKEQAILQAQETLKSFGIAHLSDRFVLHLSGGEKKMVALAGIMIATPELLLLDEPTNALDEAMQHTITSHLQTIDKSMVIVSHHTEFVRNVVQAVYRMEEGRLVRQ
jgi:cobalt/nickel transport system ATP-binding protein